jgi:hypothetical protein
MQARESRRDDVPLSIEQEPNADLVRLDRAHSTIFANWFCSDR